MMAQPIRRILVATDFSEYSRRAMEYARSLAERMGASIDLLHVWEPPQYLESETLVMEPGEPGASLASLGLAQASRLLHAWSERYLSSSVPIQLHLEQGPAAETIVRIANSGYDLVVMGTHGRTGLARLFMGSIAQKVVARATCPVLTVHGVEEQEAQPVG